MSGLGKLLAASMLALGACAPTLQRDLLYEPIYIPQTETLWLIEKESRASAARAEAISVIVCHREATPACIRVRPVDPLTRMDYTRWHSSIPASPSQAVASAPTSGGANPLAESSPQRPVIDDFLTPSPYHSAGPEPAQSAPSAGAQPAPPAQPIDPPSFDAALRPATLPRAPDNPY
jgi:hypothetical protein